MHIKHSQKRTALCETAFLGVESSLNMDEDGDTPKSRNSFRGTFLSGRTNDIFFTCSVLSCWYYNWLFFIEWWLDLNFPTIIRENSSNEKVRALSFSEWDCLPEKCYKGKKPHGRGLLHFTQFYSCSLFLNSQEKVILDSSIRFLEAVKGSLPVTSQKTLRDNLVNIDES